VSSNQEIVKRAIALLERADQLRAEARQVLDPINKARGWRGASDTLSGLMSFDLPRQSDLVRLRTQRRADLLGAANELDSKGVSIEAVPNPSAARRSRQGR
jgi:hypothetical protein